MNSENNDGVRASAILHMSGTDLTKPQQTILDLLPKVGSTIKVKSGDVTMDDLAAMTAKSKVEFSLFEGASDGIIMRGESARITVAKSKLEEMNAKGYKWIGHTHANMTTYPSDGDYEVLSYFDQEFSYIYNIAGKHEPFYKL